MSVEFVAFMVGANLSWSTAPPAATNQDSAAPLVQIGFGETERFADPQAGAPEQDDQRTEPVTVGTVASRAHHRDDLVDSSAGQPDSEEPFMPSMRACRPWLEISSEVRSLPR